MAKPRLLAHLVLERVLLPFSRKRVKLKSDIPPVASVTGREAAPQGAASALLEGQFDHKYLHRRIQSVLWGAQEYALSLAKPGKALPASFAEKHHRANPVFHRSGIGPPQRPGPTRSATALSAGIGNAFLGFGSSGPFSNP
ncbi:MAG: hypothetical protein ACLP1U_11935 [Terracidiphilus sp.]